jgi:quinol monooxygenase YgiN
VTTGYGLVVRFELRDEQAARGFDDLVERTLPGIRNNEPGTLLYVTHHVPDEPLVRVFYELYADREGFEEHERQPHVRDFLAERERYVARVEVTFVHAAAGKLSSTPKGSSDS